MLGFFFFIFLLSLLTFSKLLKKKDKPFRSLIRVSNRLDPDQDQHCVGPGLDTNSLQRLYA